MAEIKWKYNIGDRIIDYKEDGKLKRDLTIIDKNVKVKEYKGKDTFDKTEINRKKVYKYHCNICGRDSGWIYEENLFNRKDGCPHRDVLVMEWKYQIGDRVVDYNKDDSIKRDLSIIDKKVEVVTTKSKYGSNGFRNRKVKYYKYRCNVCGWDDGWMQESSLYHNKRGCSCCCNQIVVKGVNDVATTHPHLVQYFKNKDEAFEHPAGTLYCPELICPNCGYVKKKLSIATLAKYGFGCHSCSDGISYPEKFVNAFLKQLNVEYWPQLTHTTYLWCGQYRYDFLVKINNEEYIVETHGMQHYDAKFGWSDDTEENDRNKKQLAEKNGFDDKHYVVFDCRHSELDWIKHSITESVFAEIFDLTNINWNICHEFALKTLIKEVCIYWEEHKTKNITTLDVAKHFKINRTTITRYLKKGKQLNWCTYDAVEENKKHRSKKKVVAFDHEMNLIKVFDSCVDVEKESINVFGKLLKKDVISDTCRRKKNHDLQSCYFWYLEDYIKEHPDFDYTKYLNKTA